MTLQISADACYRLIGRYTMNSLLEALAPLPPYIRLSLYLSSFPFDLNLLVLYAMQVTEDLFRLF